MLVIGRVTSIRLHLAVFMEISGFCCTSPEFPQWFFLFCYCCCLGVLVKSESTDRSLRGHEEWLSICGKRLLSSSPNKMENNNNMIRSPEVHLSSCSSSVDEENKFLQENGNSSSFINKAAIAWNEMRREWVGDRSKRSHSRLREPIISWSATYDDLLSVGQPFPQPIPLSEMVDFLVDIWNEEGLYD